MPIRRNSRVLWIIPFMLIIGSNLCALAHTDITAEQARDLIESTNDLIVVDVREPSEYCNTRGHIPGALNYPWSSGILRARYEELPNDGPLLVVCASGGRSNAAASFLDSKDFSIVYDMLRGMSAWQWETADCKYSGGSGTANDPYQIATAEDLIALGETPEDYDKHFILTADIDLDPNLAGRKVFGGAVTANLAGVFDGNKHTISHLTIKGGSDLGLFGRLESGAEVRDVGVVNVHIIGSGHAIGGLVGYNYDGTVARCYSTGAISGTSYVGGLIGDNGDVLTILTPGARVTDSYSDSTVDGSGCVGGLVGGNWGSIATSYSTGIVSGTGGAIGGLVGYNRGYGDITYCYASCSISVGQNSNRIGGLVGYNDGEITQCFASGSIVSEGDSTKLGGLVGNNVSPDYSISDCFWDVETSGLSESDGGTGLTTVQMQDPNILADAGWDFVHQSDGPSDIWAEPEGGGYPILWWQLPESQWPALPSFSGGTGGADNPYLISTPQELNSIGHNPRLMAAHFRLIEDIDLADVRFFTIGNEIFPFNGTFDGNGHAISDFRYTSTNRNHGGFFGYIDCPIAEVRNLGLIDPNIDSTTEWKVGSLVGQLEHGTIAACYVSGGSVSGGGYIRGLENTGTSIIGGLAGVSYGTITDCHTSCSVFGPKYVGGLLGAGEGIITNCSFSGEATGGDYVGGLVALGQGTITKCASSGDVSGNDIIGGLIGVNSGEVTYCYASSNVSSNGSEAGGLVGENGGTITDSYATGDTSGNNIVGGLVGSNGYIISGRGDAWRYPGHTSNCYSTGSISGTSNVGGLLGRNLAGSITSSLWDKESSSQYEMCGIQNPQASGCDNIQGKTSIEMQTASTFLEAGWDFVGEMANGTEDIWWIDEGKDYPRLWWEPPKYGGGTGEPNNPYLIYTAEHLNEMSAEPNDWDKHFKLMADIDLAGYVYDAALIAPDGDPCDPAFVGTSFMGVFDGNGHAISNLTILGEGYLGLFGRTESGAVVENLGLIDVNIAGTDYVGGLVGFSKGNIANSYVTGTINGDKRVGGLTGRNWGSIATSYNTASVTGNDDVGGLAAANYGGIANSYNTGPVTANRDVGGLVGENYGSIAFSYSAGAVSGAAKAGGLVGYNWPDTGIVSGFYDIETSGLSVSDGGIGKTTAEMQTAGTFIQAGWDLAGETANGTEDIWWIDEGKDYPHLWWEAGNN